MSIIKEGDLPIDYKFICPYLEKTPNSPIISNTKWANHKIALRPKVEIESDDECPTGGKIIKAEITTDLMLHKPGTGESIKVKVSCSGCKYQKRFRKTVDIPY